MISPSDMPKVFTVRSSFIAPHYHVRYSVSHGKVLKRDITCVIVLAQSKVHDPKTLAKHLSLTFSSRHLANPSPRATEQALQPSCIGGPVPFNAMQPKMTCSSMILLPHAVTIVYSTQHSVRRGIRHAAISSTATSAAVAFQRYGKFVCLLGTTIRTLPS